MKKLFSEMAASVAVIATLCFSFQESKAQTWNQTGDAITATSLLGSTNNFPLRLIANNVERMRLLTNGKLGVGNLTPVAFLTVQSSGGVPAGSWITSGSPLYAGFGEATIGNADFYMMMASATASARGVYGMKRARGTLAAPAAVATNDHLGSLLVSGYDGTGFQGSAAVDFFADGAPSAGNVPARISFVTGSNSGNRTERLKIGNTGNIYFNSTQLTVLKASGNVGIGTATPAAKLDVSGDALINGIIAGRGTGNVIGNSVFGMNALASNTTGVQNTGVGSSALFSNTTGNANTGVGVNALLYNTTGSYNTSYGSQSLAYNTIGSHNNANGYAALSANINGDNNTADGNEALTSNTTGQQNTAVGSTALFSNTTGSNNSANGYGALRSNTTGFYNTANGDSALYFNTAGAYNTANGFQALRSNTTGIGNAVTGVYGLRLNTSGFYNTANGFYALYSNSTGYGNTANGTRALYNNTSGSTNTGIGYEANTAVTTQNNTTGIGYDADPTADNTIAIGNTSVTSIKGQVGFTTYSDQRFKKDIKEGEVKGLEFITKLRAVTYNSDIRAYAKWKEANYGEEATADWVGKYDIENIRFSGFLAQEVEATAKSIGYDFSGVDKPKNAKDIYGLRYAEFVVPLVKAVQELNARNEELTAKATKVDDLQKQIDELKAMITVTVSTAKAALSSTNVKLSSASLEQNIPNPPVNNATRISYNIPAGSINAEMLITDFSGKKVKQVSLSNNGKGILNVDTAGLNAGSYSYTLYVDGKLIETKKMIVAGK